MTVTQDAVGRRVVLSPQEGLVAGGPAEEFEQRVQALFRNGSTDLLVDLRQVPTIDSRGVRALVRAHTSAQRLGATFRIACPSPAVRTILEVSKLDSVFVVYDTIDAAQKRDLRWDLVWTAMAERRCARRSSPAGCAGPWPATRKRSDCRPGWMPTRSPRNRSSR